MHLIKESDYESISKTVCQMISDKIQAQPNLVLGLATGSTPKRLYELLVKKYKEDTISFSAIHTFNLDEYVGLGVTDKNSYHYYMDKHLFQHINIPKNNIHIPNPETTDLQQECKEYERAIQETGGIDIQILGLGINGHIGFNEPGTSFHSRTHVVNLTDSTRKANARFFPSLEQVPTKAITMGIGTIMNCKQIILMVSGEEKASALKKVLSNNRSEETPATVLQTHPNVTIVADKAALSLVD